jgi:cytochrome oxidase Cu insertion factor (SCO1/SenC/PrrC family)
MAKKTKTATKLSLPLNLQQIQGNILDGFNKDYQSFLFLRVVDRERARSWLQTIISEVATADEVQDFARQFKKVNRRRGGELGVLKATWMNVAFTFSGLQALGAPGVDQFPEAFSQGMRARAQALGDVGPSAPENWVQPFRDPGTPERLKEWGRRFQAGPGWSLITGRKPDVDQVLKALGSFAPDKRDHPSTVVIVNGATGQACRASGLATPPQLAKLMQQFPAAPPAPEAARPPGSEESAARNYFTDTIVLDQEGRRLRFYSDLLRDKVVVINTFFSDCPGSCVRMSTTLNRLQGRLGGWLGKDVHLISISVDPATDTPSKLRAYADRFGARPGWYFLTGDKENVGLVLKKLGQFVADRDSHSSLMIMGNERTGLWKKVAGLEGPDVLFPILDEVIKDRPPAAGLVTEGRE